MKDNIGSQLKKIQSNAVPVKRPLQMKLGILGLKKEKRDYLDWEKLSQFPWAGKLLLTQTHFYWQESSELIANAKPQLGVGRTESVKCSAHECQYQSPLHCRAGVPPPSLSLPIILHSS